MAEETVWTAAIFGELDQLKNMVENDPELPIDEPDDRGFTPLTWSARNGHDAVLQFLIDQKCSMEHGSFAGMKPLHHTCNKNLESTTKLLLKAGAEVNSTDDNLDMPLHWASSRGVLNIVIALIEGGADLNACNEQGVTPLHKATLFGQTAIVKNLCERGADPNAADSAGDTALHLAARSGFGTIVDVLLKVGANKETPNAAGQKPVDYAGKNKAILSKLEPAPAAE